MGLPLSRVPVNALVYIRAFPNPKRLSLWVYKSAFSYNECLPLPFYNWAFKFHMYTEVEPSALARYSWARISECMYVCLSVCPRTLGQSRKRNNWSTELKFGTRIPYGNTQGCFFHFFKFPFFSRVIPILPGFCAYLTSFNQKLDVKYF